MIRKSGTKQVQLPSLESMSRQVRTGVCEWAGRTGAWDWYSLRTSSGCMEILHSKQPLDGSATSS